jgi:hypothetical protein
MRIKQFSLLEDDITNICKVLSTCKCYYTNSIHVIQSKNTHQTFAKGGPLLDAGNQVNEQGPVSTFKELSVAQRSWACECKLCRQGESCLRSRWESSGESSNFQQWVLENREDFEGRGREEERKGTVTWNCTSSQAIERMADWEVRSRDKTCPLPPTCPPGRQRGKVSPVIICDHLFYSQKFHRLQQKHEWH